MITKAEISLVRSLADKRGREEHGLFAAEGMKLVGELTSSGMEIERIYTTEEADMAFAGVKGADAWASGKDAGSNRNRARAKGTGIRDYKDGVSTGTCSSGASDHKNGVGATGIRGSNTACPDCDIRRISPAEMKRISSLRTPTGVLALVKIPSHDLHINKNELTICLDDIQDPGNLGTIIRLADWFGIRDIVCSPGTADCFNPKVVQATMGAIARVRVHYTDIRAFLSRAAKDAPVYGTFLDGESIYGSELSSGGIIVLGNEGNGISGEIASIVSRRLYIPPFPPGEASVESLNVAVATAIVCSEFRRRQ